MKHERQACFDGYIRIYTFDDGVESILASNVPASNDHVFTRGRGPRATGRSGQLLTVGPVLGQEQGLHY